MKSEATSAIEQADDRQPLAPRICDACYDVLSASLDVAGANTLVAVHCPHYRVLMEVDLVDGVPLGVVMTGPISQDEANSMINDQYK
jgi:hypothetical protein